MFGTEFVTEFVIGSIGAAAAKMGVDIVAKSAVQNVVLTNVQKVCVWTAQTAAGTMVAGHTYKTITHRDFKDDALEVLKGVFKKDDNKEVKEVKTSDSKEEVSVA